MSLSDLESAYRARDAIRQIAHDVVYSEYPRPRHATVQSVDVLSRNVVLRYPDEVIDFTVKAGSMLPEVGAVVRLAGPNGARYIEDVISGDVSVAGIDTSGGIGIWVAVSFAAGWGNLGGGYQGTQYRLEGESVRLRGIARKFGAVANGEALFTLPTGHRPPAGIFTSAWTSDGGASPIQAQRSIEIETTGRVLNGSAALSGGTNWISFDHTFSISA